MNNILRHVALLAAALVVASGQLYAQSKWRDTHKVKKKETIFGIAKKYDITVDQLIEANPEMKLPGYELKKGDIIFIPYAKAEETTPVVVQQPVQQPTNQRLTKDSKKITVGIMLPLHDVNGDGRRMVEYYRGVLMACDSLKQEGYQIDVHAWNFAEDANITPFLADPYAARCDLIIGPLYSRQCKQISDFAKKNNTKILIPFSINTDEIFTNRQMFQVYQSPIELNETVIEKFMERFGNYHPVFIDCNDSTSQKGMFTSGLRRRLEAKGTTYSITNLKSSESVFANSFSKTQPNVVILNSARSPELNVAFAKLNSLKVNQPTIQVSMFGYTEWLMYVKYNLDNFFKFDTYIPSTFYYDPLAPQTKRIETKYRWNFHEVMMDALPRFAITGFDQAYYFIKGMLTMGDDFAGARGTVGYRPIQTPLRFERTGNGGLRNRALLLIHYKPTQRVEKIEN